MVNANEGEKAIYILNKNGNKIGNDFQKRFKSKDNCGDDGDRGLR